MPTTIIDKTLETYSCNFEDVKNLGVFRFKNLRKDFYIKVGFEQCIRLDDKERSLIQVNFNDSVIPYNAEITIIGEE